MTRFAPGNVQTRNPLSSRGRCCCCCSLRGGVITLGILLVIKGIMLAVQWYFFSQNYSQYASYWNDSTDDNDSSSYHYVDHDDENDSSSSGSGSSHGSPHNGPQHGSSSGTMEDSTMPTMVVDYAYTDQAEDTDMYVDVDYTIPDWLVVVAWVCVSWHIIGGLMGTFAGCSYSKKCAFGFWLWWVITWVVTLACVVLYFVYFESTFHWACAIVVTLGMALLLYFTVAVKRFYNLLRDEGGAIGYGYFDGSASV